MHHLDATCNVFLDFTPTGKVYHRLRLIFGSSLGLRIVVIVTFTLSPPGEQCFAQANCQKGVIKGPPTTPAPISGTFAPTLTQLPSVQPTASLAPSVYTSKSPEVFPTLTPTTEYPTLKPTLGTCQGDPVRSKMVNAVSFACFGM